MKKLRFTKKLESQIRREAVSKVFVSDDYKLVYTLFRFPYGSDDMPNGIEVAYVLKSNSTVVRFEFFHITYFPSGYFKFILEHDDDFSGMLVRRYCEV